MKPQLTAYCLDWHINFSNAFYELLVVPLSPYSEIQLTAWNGKSESLQENWKQHSQSTPTIFCQRPPTPEILSVFGAKLIWIPMWDNVVSSWSSDEWWASLPKTLRIVALSEGVERMARKAGLPVMRLHYYKDPAKFAAVDWGKGRVLYYWNRIGLFGPKFIAKLCETLGVSELYFRGSVDPKIARGAAYSLPSKIRKTVVHQVSRFDSQTDYFEILRRCNIYLAPRAVEGVGLTFLEAMAGGCAVMAYDAPTMKEYLEQGVDGFLFSNTTLESEPTSLFQKAEAVFLRKADERLKHPRISLSQDWENLSGMDLTSLGRAAREKQGAGFSEWTNRLPEYADFILNW